MLIFLYFWWCNGVGLVLKRSQVWLSAISLSCNETEQVVHTHVPLPPSRTIWYWPQSGEMVWVVYFWYVSKLHLSQNIDLCQKSWFTFRRSVAGKVTSGLLLHWPYGTSQTRWHIQLPTYEFTLLNGLRHGNEPMLWKIWHLYLLLLPTIPHRQSPCGYVWSITQKYKWIPKCSNLV